MSTGGDQRANDTLKRRRQRGTPFWQVIEFHETV